MFVPVAVLPVATFAAEFAWFVHSPVGWGQSGAQVNAGQGFVRAVIVYGSAVLLVRLGKRRSLSGASVFDAVMLEVRVENGIQTVRIEIGSGG